MKQKFPPSLQLSFRKSARQVRNRSKGECQVHQTWCYAEKWWGLFQPVSAQCSLAAGHTRLTGQPREWRNTTASSSYPSDFTAQLPSWGTSPLPQNNPGNEGTIRISSEKLPLGKAFPLPPAPVHAGSSLPSLLISVHPLMFHWSFLLTDPFLSLWWALAGCFIPFSC